MHHGSDLCGVSALQIVWVFLVLVMLDESDSLKLDSCADYYKARKYVLLWTLKDFQGNPQLHKTAVGHIAPWLKLGLKP